MLSIKEKPEFEMFNEMLSQDILDIYRDFHLRPALKRPPELFDGFPEGRENLVVMFKSEEPNQYLIEEPGSICYWRDYSYNNIWTRTAFEFLWPYVLYDVFKEKNYHLNYLQ